MVPTVGALVVRPPHSPVRCLWTPTRFGVLPEKGHGPAVCVADSPLCPGWKGSGTDGTPVGWSWYTPRCTCGNWGLSLSSFLLAHRHTTRHTYFVSLLFWQRCQPSERSCLQKGVHDCDVQSRTRHATHAGSRAFHPPPVPARAQTAPSPAHAHTASAPAHPWPPGGTSVPGPRRRLIKGTHLPQKGGAEWPRSLPRLAYIRRSPHG
jgi:hypothetical protein